MIALEISVAYYIYNHNNHDKPMMKFREATIEDLTLLQYWDKQEHILEAGLGDGWAWETELQRSPDWREQWIAELEGVPIGFLQIIDPALEETQYWGNVSNDLRAIDIWISEVKYLGKGYGKQMMQWAISRCFANSGVRAIWVDPLSSNVKAHRFYERLGFRFAGCRELEGEECFVYQLDRIIL